MIELKDCLVVGKNIPKTEINQTFDSNQVNHISYQDRYIFNLLKLKNQSLEKGEFIIDENKIYPQEENGKSLFFLAVNSVINLGLCFLVEPQEKKEKVKHIQDELILLREMPIGTDIEKNLKIAAIFEKICAFLPSYMLVDLNDQNNSNNPELIRQIDKCFNVFPIIVLDSKPIDKVEEKEALEEEEFVMVDLNIGEETKVSYSKQKGKSDQTIAFSKGKGNFGKLLWLTFKKNLMVFLSFLIPSIGVFAFILLSPLYAKTDNKGLLIPFIITIVVCFSLYMLMTYKCADFDSSKKKEKLSFFILNTVVTLCGYGLGFLIFILFKNFDSDLKQMPISNLSIVLSIVFLLILVTANLYLYTCISTIINKLKKKK